MSSNMTDKRHAQKSKVASRLIEYVGTKHLKC